MKKYLLGSFVLVFVFGLFSIININSVSATTPASEEGCSGGGMYNYLTGEKCVSSYLPDGCAPGYKFSTLTGEACAEGMVSVPPSYEEPTCMYPAFGSRGEDIKALQQKIHSAGFTLEKIDGIYGYMTAEAAARYYKQYPCPETGSVVISGVKGPQTLQVGQTGTWTVTAHDKNGQDLEYGVVWGDEGVYNGELGAGYAGVSSQYWKQSATFTHKYLKPGNYTPKFRVMNENGDVAKTSLSVKVGTITSPLSCSILQQTQKSYYDNCKSSGFENVCFSKDGVYQGCSNKANNDCTENNENASKNILCSVGTTQPTIITATSEGGSIYPSGNVSVPVGSNKTFKFSPNVGYQVRVINIDNKLDLPPASSYTFYNVTGSHIIGVSFAPISTQSSVTVLSPNGGETWAKGTTQTIKWEDKNDISTHEVRLVSTEKLYPPTLPCYQYPCPTSEPAQMSYTIANTQGSSYKWVVGQSWETKNVPEGTYTIKVCQSGTKVCDSSDGYFKITRASTIPAVKVLSPNGGEVWTNGANKTITWQGNKVSTYDVSLHPVFTSTPCTTRFCTSMPSYLPYPIAKNVYSSSSNFQGSYGWQVGSTENGSIIPDGKYTIQVCETGTGTCDQSDTFFTIQSTETTITPTVDLVANPSNVSSGGSAVLAWSTANATYCGASGGTNGWGGEKSLSGNFSTGALTSDTTYYLTCKNDNNVARGDSVTIRVAPTSQPLTISAERQSDSPSGNINSGNNVLLFSFKMRPSGQDATIKKLTFDVVGTGVTHTNNLKVYADGTEIGKLTDLRSTWSSVHYTADAYLDWVIEADDFVEVSVRGDISAAPYNPYMWINLTEIGTNPAITNSSISGLPVSGHQVNIISNVTTVLGAETYTFTQKLMRGSQGGEVMELQKYLKEAGYYSGNLDGKFGVATEAGVTKFQTAKNIKVDGIVGTEMRAVLNK